LERHRFGRSAEVGVRIEWSGVLNYGASLSAFETRTFGADADGMRWKGAFAKMRRGAEGMVVVSRFRVGVL
jgi:hypothetical protein